MTASGASRPRSRWPGVLTVCVVPLLVCVAALSLRRAQGPFWLAANQDPAYSYLYDSLRVARGLPPNHVQHPGTALQMLGAAALRATTGGGPSPARRVLADPETALRHIHAVLLAACALGMAALGWSTLVGTRRPVLCWLAQGGALLTPGTLVELAGVKPEPLLLALSMLMGAALAGHDRGPGAIARSVVLGAVSGLALAAKFTAFPLAVVALLALEGIGPRLRFGGAAALAFLVGTLPALHQLGESIAFVLHSVGGSGMYGTGVFVSGYGPALRSALLDSAAFGVVAASTLAALVSGPASHPDRRLLRALLCGQACALAILVRQPWGGVRYLVPEAGLLGLTLAVLARLFVWNGQGRLRSGPALLFAAFVTIVASLELRSLAAYASDAARDARAQEEAARAAGAAHGCALVEYHKASSVPSALLFGYGRPLVDGGDLALLQGLYPSALFLDYVTEAAAAPSDFRFLPYESWTHPRFRNFAGGLTLAEVVDGRSCIAFHGSTGGPGRLHVSPGFAGDSLPVEGRADPLHAGPLESVYRVELGAGVASRTAR
jgi:hypothetical protein